MGQTCAQPVPLNHQSVPAIEDLQGVGEVGVGRVLHIEQLVAPASVGVVKLEEAGHVVHLEADPEAEGGGEGGPLLQGLLDRGGLALHEPCVVDVTAGLVEGAVSVVDDQVGAGDGVEKLTADREDSAACKKRFVVSIPGYER